MLVVIFIFFPIKLFSNNRICLYILYRQACLCDRNISVTSTSGLAILIRNFLIFSGWKICWQNDFLWVIKIQLSHDQFDVPGIRLGTNPTVCIRTINVCSCDNVIGNTLLVYILNMLVLFLNYVLVTTKQMYFTNILLYSFFTNWRGQFQSYHRFLYIF
jgi:hypothetical protein